MIDYIIKNYTKVKQYKFLDYFIDSGEISLFKSVDEFKILCSLYEIYIKRNGYYNITNSFRDRYFADVISINMFYMENKNKISQINKNIQDKSYYINYFNRTISSQVINKDIKDNKFKLKLLNKFEKILFKYRIFRKLKNKYVNNINWDNISYYKVTSRLHKV